MYFFLGGMSDLGMFGEIGVKRCCSAFLGTDDDEVWGFGSLFHGLYVLYFAVVLTVPRRVKRKFDRTWTHYSNSIALGGITAIRSPNLDVIAPIRLTIIPLPDLDCRFR